MALTRTKTNVHSLSKTGVPVERYEGNKNLYPLSFFGYTGDEGTFTPALEAGKSFIRSNGFGGVYIPPTTTYNYPVIVTWLLDRFVIEMWDNRPPINMEERPYNLGAFMRGDRINAINVNEQSVLGWICVTDGVPGEWRVWGDLKRFYSDVQKFEELPIPQAERESQVVFVEGRIYVCKQINSEWTWEIVPTEEELDVLGDRVTSVETSIDDINSQLRVMESGLDWKEAVETFEDLAIAYPEPMDGWTVNVKSTDMTYRYTGTEWIAISANAIPLATHDVDGKMSAADKQKLDDIKPAVTEVEVRGETQGPGVSKLNFSAVPSALVTPELQKGESEATIGLTPNGIAICRLSDGPGPVMGYVNNEAITELVIVQDIAVPGIVLNWDKDTKNVLTLKFLGGISGTETISINAEGATKGSLHITGVNSRTKVLLLGSDIDVKKAKGITLSIAETASNITIDSLQDCSFLAGPVLIKKADKSIINITTSPMVSLQEAVDCQLHISVGDDTTYEFSGYANKIESLVGTGVVIGPLDTVVSKELETSGLFKYRIKTGNNDIIRLPVQEIDKIKDCYVSEGRYKAVLVKTSDALATGADGTLWEVFYNDDETTPLSEEQIKDLNTNVLVEIDPEEKKVFVPRPATKMWTGTVADLPAERDEKTIYFVY